VIFADRIPAEIVKYGYEIWHGDTIICWYDSQPPPNDPTLAETMPHHKHVHPNIKHNRIPAPAMTLRQPGIPRLIEEVEAEL